MKDTYELIFVYKYYNDFTPEKVCLAKNGLIVNGHQSKKVKDIYNEVSEKVPFSSKRKGLFIKKEVSKEELSSLNIEDFLNIYSICDIDMDSKEFMYILKKRKMPLSKVEIDSLKEELLKPMQEVATKKEKPTPSISEMRTILLNNDVKKLNSLKVEAQKVNDTIKKNGKSKESEKALSRISEEFKNKAAQINRLLKIQSK